MTLLGGIQDLGEGPLKRTKGAPSPSKPFLYALLRTTPKASKGVIPGIGGIGGS